MSSHPSLRPTWTSAGNLRTVLLGLASGGVCLAAVSPRRRCALTAPFHPCLCETHVKPRHRRCVSVALSRGFPRVDLPTTPPCDVRTFLDGISLPPRLLGLHIRGYRLRGADATRCRSHRAASSSRAVRPTAARSTLGRRARDRRHAPAASGRPRLQLRLTRRIGGA